ncbi:MAG: hypothetical protein JWM00_37 [Candidatus Saccharibacteria bacterium]|nr:hypothetical protein [Candidatus Saccharibacteria bacterium]
MIQRHNRQGFTLIELMLAMSFVSLLLLAIAMLTIHMSNIYTKGITIRDVNQAGLAISEDLQRSIAGSIPFNVLPNPAVKPDYKNVDDRGGRLCIGEYSYIWNYGKSLKASPSTAFTTFTDNSPIRFVKVPDRDPSLCEETGTAVVDKARATEMLAGGDRDLVLHSFSIMPAVSDTESGQVLYAIDFVLGTNTEQQIMNGVCKPPSEGVGDENYCSLNRFSIIARAGNLPGGSE